MATSSSAAAKSSDLADPLEPPRSRSGARMETSTAHRSARQSSTGTKGGSQARFTSPQDYAKAVEAYSKLGISNSVSPGQNYVNLAGYLNWTRQKRIPLFSERGSPSPLPESSSSCDPIFYQLWKLGAEKGQALQNPEKLAELEGFASVALSMADDTADANEETRARVSSLGRLLFLRGVVPPDWLNQIGVVYDVDPEFYLRHRDFAFSVERPSYFSLPSLPSTQLDMIQLRLTTIGSRTHNRGKKQVTQAEVDRLRQHTRESMVGYFERLSGARSGDLHAGESIIRSFSVHSMDYFSVEQIISIQKTETPDGGWALIVWLDIGRSLTDSQDGPLNTEPFRSDSWSVHGFPTIQHRKRVALKERGLSYSDQQVSHNEMQQSASLLHQNYVKKRDRELMAQDPFYALHNIFRFVAFSTMQLLNLISEHIQAELSHTALTTLKKQTVSNLVYNKQVLQRQVGHLNEVLYFIRSRKNSDWPRASGERNERETTDKASQLLEVDFEHLLCKAKDLVVECESGIETIAQNAMTLEAQNALDQATRVTKLTQLAFLFVPLNFTVSFFGMNFRQLNPDKGLPFWIWPVVAIPTLLVSILFMMTEPHQMRQGILAIAEWARGNRQGIAEWARGHRRGLGRRSPEQLELGDR